MKSLFALSLVGLMALPAGAATTVNWAEWEPVDNTTAVGSFWVGNHFVTVTATSTSNYNAVESTGSIYLSGPAYTQGSVANSPVGKDLIQLGSGGTITFSFSETVAEVFFAFVSWNGQPSVTFSQNVAVDSNGAGFWGTGTTSTSGAVASFSGEAHGVLTLGPTSGFTMTHATEFWHGFTLGVTPVPVPASAPLLLGALGALALRRKRKG